jgi:carboxylate-amine ligase
MFEQFTLGIEEDFQIVDPHTRELRSHVSEILEESRVLLGEQVKPEVIQSMVEVNTSICADVQEARAEIIKRRGVLSTLMRKQGLMIVAAGTHPFSHWPNQKIYESARHEIVEESQIIARSLLTFGLHVHVGVPNPERAIQIMNAIRYLLPHVLALSTSSPFWLGVNTGLKSYRSEIFARFPRTGGIPDYFESRGAFEQYVELLVKTGCIDDGKKVYWDVRPHPVFPTLEFRICDIPTRVDDTIAIAALFQAMVAKVNKLLDRNLTFRLHHKMLIEENKWRALRYGLDGKMIDFGKGTEVPVRELIRELLEFVDDVVDDLRSRKEIRHIRTILDRGTSADEQLRVWHETEDINAVEDRLIELTMENVPREITPAAAAKREGVKSFV